MPKINNLLVTICARGGSKGVKGKNIRNLGSFPMIYYTINQVKKWGKGKHFVVSTDSEEIAKIAKKYGAEVPFMRPTELATDITPTIPVLKHTVLTCEKIYKQRFDVIMDLACTSPVRKIEDLQNALNLFLEKKPKTLFSVVTAQRNPYFNMVEATSDGKAVICKPTGNFHRRQDAPKVYDMNASIYIYDRSYLLDSNTIRAESDNSIMYLMNEESRIDINTELDFKYLEFLMKENIITL